MSKGLKQLLARITENPSRLMIDRYLALLADLTPQQGKVSRALDLAEALLRSDPLQSLRIALMVHQTNPDDLRAYDLMIEGLNNRGRHAKAEVLRLERERLVEALASGQLERMAEVPDSLVNGAVMSQSEIREVSLNEPLPLGFSDAPYSGDSGNHRESEDSSESGVAPSDVASDRSFDKEFKLASSEPKAQPPKVELAEKAQRESGLFTWRGPKPAYLSGGSSPGTPFHTEILGIQDYFDPLDAQPLEPATPPLQIAPTASEGMDLVQSAPSLHSDLLAGGAGGAGGTGGKLRAGFGGHNGHTLDLFGSAADLPLPQPSQTGSGPVGPALRLTMASVKATVSDAAKSKDKDKIAVKAAPPQGTLVSFNRGMSEFWSKLLGEFGHLEAATAQPQGWAQALGSLKLRAENRREPLPESFWQALAEIPQEQLAQPDMSQNVQVMFEILVSLVDEETATAFGLLIEKLQLTRAHPGYWGLYLDTLLLRGLSRRALVEVRLLLNLNPQPAWAAVAWPRLTKIWAALAVRGFDWREEAGVMALIKGLERRPKAKTAGLVV